MKSIEDSPLARILRGNANPIDDSLTALLDVFFYNNIKAGEDDLIYSMQLEEKLGVIKALIIGSDSKRTADIYSSFQSLCFRMETQWKKLRETIENQISRFNDAAKANEKAGMGRERSGIVE